MALPFCLPSLLALSCQLPPLLFALLRCHQWLLEECYHSARRLEAKKPRQGESAAGRNDSPILEYSLFLQSALSFQRASGISENPMELIRL
jgi:hypothetical protein